MPVHERQKPPSGHGEVLCVPPFAEWRARAALNAAAVESWPERLRALRHAARAETVAEAERFTRAIGMSTAERLPGDLVVMTGHQPELYHPGVWIKDFLVQRFSDETGALGIDLVVDTDSCGGIALRVPCFGTDVRQCEASLVTEGTGAYVQAQLPDAAQLSAFREAGLAALTTLPAPSLARHFTLFCDGLEGSAATAGDVGTLMTAARRRYEAPAGTDYLEILASAQARTPAYRHFAAELLLDADRFRAVTNQALASYRQRTGARSVAQPFPDLAEVDGRVEAPFWLLADGVRRAVSVDATGLLYADGSPLMSLAATPEAVADALAEQDLLLAPRAMTLTMFQRLFVADLFVHGTGGGRYDRVTDDVIAGYYEIEPPGYVVASMTLLLPVGAHLATDSDVSAIEQRLHRFEHNPDEVLAEVEFDTVDERTRAEHLTREKAALVAAITAPGADRKALGAAIRAANAGLSALLEPVAVDLRTSLAHARAERDATAVLTDRTYPYCLWDPREVMDKVR